MIILIGLFEVAFVGFVWYSKVIIDTATEGRMDELLYYAVLLVVLIVSNLFRLLDIRMRRMTEVRWATPFATMCFRTCFIPVGKSCRHMHI